MFRSPSKSRAPSVRRCSARANGPCWCMLVARCHVGKHSAELCCPHHRDIRALKQRMCAKGRVVRLTDPRCDLRVSPQRARRHCSSLFHIPRPLRVGRGPPRCDAHLIVPRSQDIIVRVRTLVMQYHGGQKNYRINSCETPGPVTFWELILEEPLGRQSKIELIRQQRRGPY